MTTTGQTNPKMTEIHSRNCLLPAPHQISLSVGVDKTDHYCVLQISRNVGVDKIQVSNNRQKIY